MKINSVKLILALLLVVSSHAWAHIGPIRGGKPKDLVSNRAVCRPGLTEIDMDINNVRARLRTGGDVWWDGSNGLYIVPKPAPGQPAVSSIFAGGVWVGGKDVAGNLKLAGVTYRSLTSDFDWYPGPLDPAGQTDEPICKNWDRFFTVYGNEVRAHLAAFDRAKASGGDYDCDSIPANIKYWPGQGNPFWNEKYTFPLPDQSLGAFYDNPNPIPDGIYNPCDGDFPTIEIRDCPYDIREKAIELVPDQMIFWIYNDNGGPHRLTAGDAIQMEVQVQSFAYATNDEINDMSFYRYKLINRADSDIRDCYFGMWVDPDLGCYVDDYSGCDTTRLLAYTYNEDALDGSPGTSCPGGTNTYGERIPIIGTDYFRGPRGPKVFVKDGNGQQIWVNRKDLNGNNVLDSKGNPIFDKLLRNPEPETGELDTLIELGMTAFVVTNNSGTGNPDPATTDPDGVDEQFYFNLQGLWRTGDSITVGGTGYNPGGGVVTKYAFSGNPDDPNGWSMCTEKLGFGDRRTLQATGPLLLQPGAINELIIGAVFVPDIDYPCPDIERLQSADDVAQALFNNCFDITDGPDAPNIEAIELDRQLILTFTNDEGTSNNAFLGYKERDLRTPIDTVLYRFEGYKVYQLSSPSVTAQELGNPDKARLVLQTDLKNKVSEIFNWTPEKNPNSNSPNQPKNIWTYSRKVFGANKGLQSTLSILEDQFAKGDRRLVNHKQYHFMAVAYAHNEYLPFNPEDGTGQRTPYLEGRKNVFRYSYTPRPIVYENLNSVYGEGIKITRLTGQGNGGNFLDVSPATREAMAKGTLQNGRVEYLDGAGPIDIKIYNPLEVTDGKYRLDVRGSFDNSQKVCGLKSDANYVITDLSNNQVIGSATSLRQLNEQIIYKRGFSVRMGQTDEPGLLKGKGEKNGTISSTINYTDPSAARWFNPLPDGGFIDFGPIIGPMYDQVATGSSLDPENNYGRLGNGTFYPFALSRYQTVPPVQQLNIVPFLTTTNIEAHPITLDANSGTLKLQDLNNVDIVLTPNKDLWSRCIVVETATSHYSDAASAGRQTLGGEKALEVRTSPSVGKDGKPDGTGTGFSWFPGYAVDVETGQRLNIFFGENTTYRGDDTKFLQLLPTDKQDMCTDMIWNPHSRVFAGEQIAGPQDIPMSLVAGGQHYIYVTRQKYDECANLATKLKKGVSPFNKRDPLGAITWTSIPLISATNPLKSIEQGLIPSEVVVKLRVDNSYNKERKIVDVAQVRQCQVEEAFPSYEFEITGKSKKELEKAEYAGALANVLVVPNPYFAYSGYETSQFTNVVKITNLPERAVITIYSLDGKFIRKIDREERPRANGGTNPANKNSQNIPDVEWDMKNFQGISVASGVYLIHIAAPDLGEERTIKWFGINRKFDPSGL